MNPLWVFLGGGTGAVIRWWVSGLHPSPWPTLAVNVAGSLLLAFLLHPATGLTPAWRLGLGTGLMGGLTTYSTFNYEVLTALQNGEPGKAVMLVVATVTACLVGGAAGWALAPRLYG